LNDIPDNIRSKLEMNKNGNGHSIAIYTPDTSSYKIIEDI